MIVAVDGPAGAGKSTVARAAAAALEYRFVDTGAMYRAVALAALEAGADLEDGAAVARIARGADIDTGPDRVLLGGRDVTARIREDDVTAAVPGVSASPEVRAALVECQRALASEGDVVMEGRDIGSVVVPDADVKVFLTASLEERARRRVRQLGLPEDEATVARHVASIAARDRADSSRATSPLLRAQDAVEIDTTGMAFDDVVAAVVELVRRVEARGA